jgi:hypothetical protein
MSIDSDKVSNLYSINKIIKKDGTIDLTNLEVLSSLNDFIKSYSYTSNSSLKLNDEDLLEVININKNIDDTRSFLEKIDTFNYSSNCSSNIELVIDTSKEVSPPPEEVEEEEVSPPQEVEEEEEVFPGIINSITSLNIKTSSKPTTRKATSSKATSSKATTRKSNSKASSKATTRKSSSKATSSKATSSKATKKKGTK